MERAMAVLQAVTTICVKLALDYAFLLREIGIHE